MKKQDLIGLKNKSIDVLQKALAQAQEASRKIRMELSLGKTKNVHAISWEKKEIAQLQTAIRAKQILEKMKGSK